MVELDDIFEKEWDGSLQFVKPIKDWHNVKLVVNGVEHVRFHEFDRVKGGEERTHSTNINRTFEGALNHVISELSSLLDFNARNIKSYKIEKESLSRMSNKPKMVVRLDVELTRGQTEKRHFVLDLFFSFYK